jgi:hypothetical protein
VGHSPFTRHRPTLDSCMRLGCTSSRRSLGCTQFKALPELHFRALYNINRACALPPTPLPRRVYRSSAFASAKHGR